MNADATPSESPEIDWPELLTRAALVLALALVALRITVLEVVRDVFAMSNKEYAAGLGPGPTTTLLLDLLCWTPALLVLIRRAVDRRYTLRLHVSHLLMAILAGWVAISCFWASDKFQAIVTASTWCAAMSLGWATCQLVRSWTRLRLVSALAVGLVAIFLAQGIVYRVLEWPETVKEWDRIRDQTFQQQGWSPDDFSAKQYDRKIRAGEMVGFFRSPNTYAAATALTALVALGLGSQRLKDNDAMALPVLCIAPMVFSTWILVATQSRTAQAGFFLCVGVFFLAWKFSPFLASRSRVIYMLACGVVVAGALAMIALGLTTGGLIHDSMTFRWNYWVGSWAMAKQHLLVGVGWSNFGNGYLPFRLPIAAEEIKDPHNVFVKFLTETGLVGAILAIGWIAWTAWELTRPILPRLTAAPLPPMQATGILVAVPLLFVFLRFLVNWPVSVTTTEAAKLLLFGFLLAFFLIIGTVRSTTDLNSDDRPATLGLLGILVGLGGFLLHAMVDFAFFEIGPLLLMMLLIGAVLGIRHPGAAGSRPWTKTAMGALGAVFFGLIGFIATIVIPVATAESKAAEAQELAAKQQFPAAATAMREAYSTAPVDNADYAFRYAQYLAFGHASPDEVMGAMSLAINADPANPAYWSRRAQYAAMLVGHPLGKPDRVVGDYEQYFQRNPTDVRQRLEYAKYLGVIGRAVESTNQYKLALKFNDGLHPDEPRRLRPEQVEEIKRLAP